MSTQPIYNIRYIGTTAYVDVELPYVNKGDIHAWISEGTLVLSARQSGEGISNGKFFSLRLPIAGKQAVVIETGRTFRRGTLSMIFAIKRKLS